MIFHDLMEHQDRDNKPRKNIYSQTAKNQMNYLDTPTMLIFADKICHQIYERISIPGAKNVI